MSTPPRRARASTSRVGLRLRLRGWAVRHAQSFFFALGQLSKHPWASLLTASVIGVALALPAGFFVLVGDAGRLAATWQGSLQASLYLSPSVDDAGMAALAGRLSARPEVVATRTISRREALAELQLMSGFGDVLDEFVDDNPLPAAIVVTLDREAGGEERLRAVVGEFEALDEVEMAQFDLDWARRLAALAALVERALLILAALLGLGVALVVGNTVRLAIDARREEIEIVRLFGATDAFVRRPYLYEGLLYGAGGGLLATTTLGIGFALLSGPAARLAMTYGSPMRLTGPGLVETVAILGGGIALGWLGSWVVVARHLRQIEPA